MKVSPIFRIAWRDARQTAGTSTWRILCLAPLLTVLLFGALVLFTALLLSAVEVASPGSGATGHHNVVVVPPEFMQEAGPLVNALASHLALEKAGEPRETRTLRRFTSFLAALAEAGEPQEPIAPTLSVALETDSRPLVVEIESKRSYDEVLADVPSRYDVALRLGPLKGRHLNYEIGQDPSILFSRATAGRVSLLLESFNRKQLAQGKGRWSVLRIEERVEGTRDPWVVQILLLLMGLSFTFLYNSVGLQTVAGVLAGEREARTLDVLLSLPLTWRQVLYGKVLGLVMITATPAVLWSCIFWIPAVLLLKVELPIPLFVMAELSLLTLWASIGCAVSAMSQSALLAGNRLGMVNLTLFAFTSLLLAIPGGVEGRSLFVRLLGGLTQPTALEGGILFFSLLLLALALLVLEAAYRVSMRQMG